MKRQRPNTGLTRRCTRPPTVRSFLAPFRRRVSLVVGPQRLTDAFGAAFGRRVGGGLPRFFNFWCRRCAFVRIFGGFRRGVLVLWCAGFSALAQRLGVGLHRFVQCCPTRRCTRPPAAWLVFKRGRVVSNLVSIQRAAGELGRWAATR